MKTPDSLLWTRLTILSLAAAMAVAAILVFISGSQSAEAERTLEDFRKAATVRSHKARDALFPPGIAPMVQATLSSEDREHLGKLERRLQALTYRHGLAEGFILRGGVLLVSLGCFYLFAKKQKPNQSLQPTALLGRG
jgi:hypothetical protein